MTAESRPYDARLQKIDSERADPDGQKHLSDGIPESPACPLRLGMLRENGGSVGSKKAGNTLRGRIPQNSWQVQDSVDLLSELDIRAVGSCP